MLEYPVTSIRLTNRPELVYNTPVWNLQTLEDDIWVRIDSRYYSPDNVLVGAYESGSDSLLEDLEVLEKRPWIKMRKDNINTSPGKHLYGFIFKDTKRKIEYQLFLSYIIQDDDPDKPYIYMNREG